LIPSEKVISIPNGGSIKEILGLKLWVRGNDTGVPLNSPKWDEDHKIVWGAKTLSFVIDGMQFTAILN
jgi:hypothetical protein